MQTAYHNLAIVRELAGVFALFQEQSIPVMPLKGPALALFLDGNAGLGSRPSGDLDVWVRRRDAGRAERVLLSNGYRPWSPLTGARRKAYLRSQCHSQWAGKETGILIELHWQLMPDSFFVPFDEELLWERAGTVSVGGTAIPHLSAEDTLLFLCAHGSKHLWESLKWVEDVARLVEGVPIDWSVAAACARKWGAWRMTAVGLLLANQFRGTPLPESLSGEILKDPVVRSLAFQMRQRIFLEKQGQGGFLEVFPFYLRFRERWRDKLADTARHLFKLMAPTEKEWERWPLPDALFGVYYLLRPFRLAAKYAGRFLRGLTAEGEI